MDTLIYAFNAVMPLLLLIAMGYLLKKKSKWQPKFFSDLNNFCYRILLPVQLFYNVYKIEQFSRINWTLIGYTIAWVPITVVLGVLFAHFLIDEQRQKGAFVQSAFRSNQAIMGLPLAVELGGEAALGITSLATSIGIPLFNIGGIIVLKAYDSTKAGQSKLREIFKSLVTNPLIIGVFSGIVAVAIRSLIPTVDGVPVFTIQNQLPFLYTTIKNLSAVASPVMLICLGASLELNFNKNLLMKISAGVAMRLIIVPALAIGGAILLRSQLNLTSAEVPMLVAFFASPVSVSSAILVRELGGDEQYAGQLVVWSSVFSMVTLFAMIALLRAGGFL